VVELVAVVAGLGLLGRDLHDLGAVIQLQAHRQACEARSIAAHPEHHHELRYAILDVGRHRWRLSETRVAHHRSGASRS
jgi:hypothetical protein